jgi:hypothetical protein
MVGEGGGGDANTKAKNLNRLIKHILYPQKPPPLLVLNKNGGKP